MVDEEHPHCLEMICLGTVGRTFARWGLIANVEHDGVEHFDARTLCWAQGRVRNQGQDMQGLRLYLRAKPFHSVERNKGLEVSVAY